MTGGSGPGDDPMPGEATSLEQFGDYELIAPIAAGGMAEIFLAKRRGVEGFEKRLAVKRILPDLSSDEQFVRMFINEAKIAARLSHPNVVQIFDFGRIGSHYFIAMEFVDGHDLKTIVREAHRKSLKIPKHVAFHIASRVCAGLSHAHRLLDENGRPLHLVHRDVSPQNVLVSRAGDVKVTDFGIAKALAESPETTQGVLKGKLAYLSPEQVRGEKLDVRSDLFAVGLVLFEMLTGERCVKETSAAKILEAVTRLDAGKVARSVPGLRRGEREILETALRIDPARRYATAAEMQRAIERVSRTESEVEISDQISAFLRLLFDADIGEHTQMRLRTDVSRAPERRTSWLPAGPIGASRTWARGAAALAGGGLGLLTIASLPTTAEPPFGPALECLEAGRCACAVAEFDRHWEDADAFRDDFRGRYAEALACAASDTLENDAGSARSLLEKAVALDVERADVHYLLGKLATGQSDLDEAELEYSKAIAIDPRHADARYNLAYILFSKGRFRDAIAEYAATAELDPPYVDEIYFNIATCHQRLDDPAAACLAVEEGLRRSPESALLGTKLKELGAC